MRSGKKRGQARRVHARKKFRELTWAHLEDWAGQKIVSRGMSYHKGGSVRDLAETSEGSIIAWVQGSENYATKVSREQGRLSSECTCPYGGTCKHAVSVVLEYLDRIKNNVEMPLAGEDDERLNLLEDEPPVGEDYDDDIETDGGEDDELIEEAELALAGIDSALKKKSRKELQSMLAGILKDHPEITKERGLATASPGKKGCPALVKAVTRAIIIVSSEPGWRNYWKHEGHTPDYSPVREGLQQLLDEACADDVVRLGEKLFERGIAQIEQSHDEGETAEEIAETMPILFKALAKCSLSDPDKLERAVDFGLRDDYDLCRGLEEFMGRRFGKKAWSSLADRLLARLHHMKQERQEDSFSRNYKRDRLSDEIIRALENADREEEAVAVCFQEAEASGSFERLVKKLRGAGRVAEAEEWIRKGVKATQDRWPGIASALKKELLDIRQRKRDWLFVAALRADDFLDNPCLKTFKDLQTASEKSKVWREVRDASLKFLETGECPVGKPGWPLPGTGIGNIQKTRMGKPPFTDSLIDIAIEEKRVDDIVRWHDVKQEKKAWSNRYRDDTVATAIAHKYPDRAIAIWKDIAEGLIAQTNVNIYGEAVSYIRKVQKALDGLNRSGEWAAYLNDLTETHRRKSRFIQKLNVLTGKPIVSK